MQILDVNFLMENVDGDKELLAEIVDLFFDSSGEIVDAIREAVKRADTEALNHSAHQLKGALANVGAQAAAEAALHLENKGRQGSMTGLEDLMDALDRELERLEPELKKLAGA